MTAVAKALEDTELERPEAVASDLESLEIDLLLEAVRRARGLDFRQYARGSIGRRLWRRARAEGVGTLSGLQERLLHDPGCMSRVVAELSVTATSMFRDPSFFGALRARVLPALRTYPFIRVWAAGCATGEEVYSLAILLEEEGLYDRSRVYATDMDAHAIEAARSGRFPIRRMREYTTNYITAGGKRALSEYYVADGERATFDRSLTQNVVFAQHNLVCDGSFNEFNLIACRNVMIYFDKALQAKVHGLLHESLGMFGVLALGRKESIRLSSRENCYQELDAAERLYRRVA